MGRRGALEEWNYEEMEIKDVEMKEGVKKIIITFSMVLINNILPMNFCL